MKARTRIGLLLFTISAASLAGLAIRNGIAQQEVKADGEYTFKLDYTNGGWNADSAKTMVHAFGVGGETWILAVDDDPNDDSKIATIAVPNQYNKINVVRFNPAVDENNPDWDYRWNQTVDITLDANKDYLTITSVNGTYDYDKLVEITAAAQSWKNRFFVDASQVGDWDSDGTTTYIDFIKGESHTVVTMSKIFNYQGYRLYRYEYNSDFSATKFKIVRGNGFDGTNYDDGNCVKAYTADICFATTNASYRTITLNSSLAATFAERNDSFFANAWGTRFLSLALCYDEGGMQTGWKTALNDDKSYYSTIKDYLDNANYFRTISNEGSDPMNRAVLRYDTIWVKNAAALSSYIDESQYLNRNPSLASLPQGALVTIEKQDVAFPVGIACVSLLGIAGLGGLLLLKKKKEQ